MNVNDGQGSCASLCDPQVAGSCTSGYSCVEIGVALVRSAPVVHVCAVTGSDAALPFVGDDGGEPAVGDGGSSDASFEAISPVRVGQGGGPTP